MALLHPQHLAEKVDHRRASRVRIFTWSRRGIGPAPRRSGVTASISWRCKRAQRRAHSFRRAIAALRGRKPCDRHAERRAGDVVQPRILAEADRGRVAAVFAANAEFPGRCGCGALGGHLDQLADAVEIERDERVVLDNAFPLVGRDKGGRVVARDAEGRLGQVVGAEGEEFGGCSAMTWARIAARGSSIIVPADRRSAPLSFATSSATRSMTPFT